MLTRSTLQTWTKVEPRVSRDEEEEEDEEDEEEEEPAGMLFDVKLHVCSLSELTGGEPAPCDEELNLKWFWQEQLNMQRHLHTDPLSYLHRTQEAPVSLA